MLSVARRAFLRHLLPQSKCVSREENERRSNLVTQDTTFDEKNTSGLVTTNQVVLTKTSPCALARVTRAIQYYKYIPSIIK